MRWKKPPTFHIELIPRFALIHEPVKKLQMRLTDSLPEDKGSVRRLI
jgi:hypothetical protein